MKFFQRPWVTMTIVLVAVYALALPRLIEGSTPTLPPIEHDVVFSTTYSAGDEVTISDVQSCGCWHGPRGMAQKKFKFRIENNSRYDINLSRGPKSNIRLLVALPTESDPTITIPVPDAYSAMGNYQAAMPEGVPLRYTETNEEYTPPKLRGANDLFGLEDDWSVYMYPPNENKLIEDAYGIGPSDAGTFPTYVAQDEVKAGHSYYDQDYGEGAFVFYVPITTELFNLVIPPEDRVSTPPDDQFAVVSNGLGNLPRRVTSKAINILGIAVIDPRRQGLLGFAPAPTESMYSSPDEF